MWIHRVKELSRCRQAGGFTLIELLVVISIIALLIGMLLPSLAAARESARRLKCSINLRTLATAVDIYANDFNEAYPARVDPKWVTVMGEYYQTGQVLICPTDNPESGVIQSGLPDDSAARSYFFNGWNDVIVKIYGEGTNFGMFSGPFSMFRYEIKNVSGTFIFGEKLSGSDHYYVDLFETGGNDFTEVAHSRHTGTGQTSQGGGGANYAFADGSVKLFQYPEAFEPVNYWAVLKEYREAGWVSPTGP